MAVKAQILDLIQRAYEEEQALVANLTDAERSAAGTLDHWSAKDVVAHVTAWKERMAHRLAGAEHDETRPTADDTDRANAEIFEEYRHKSWTEVLQEAERAQRDLVQCIQTVTEDELADTQRFPWQNGQPLWRRLVGNGYSHPLAHLAQLYLERGQRDHATQLQETAAQRLLPLDDSASWRGVTIYNLACHYALSGEKEKAIAQLGEALRLNPDLTEWSKQDPDFASIREEPAYRSLYSR
jgi:tetratricopeptide (TPR) repeat protein